MNSIIDALKEVKTLTDKLDKLHQTIKKAVIAELRNTPNPDGVKQLAMNICIVPYSSINSADWTPQHYMSQCQVYYIIEKLEKAKDPKAILKIINSILEKSFIEVKGNFKIRINHKVAEVLTAIQQELCIICS